MRSPSTATTGGGLAHDMSWGPRKGGSGSSRIGDPSSPDFEAAECVLARNVLQLLINIHVVKNAPSSARRLLRGGVLRITRVENEATGICLKVEGRLVGDWVALLEGELAKAARGDAVLSLDLGAVDFASAQATEVLRAAAARGVLLTACSPFLSKLLLASTP